MGYKLLKEKGHSKTIAIENTETHASLIIGRVTPSLLSILKDCEDITIGREPGELNVNDAWDFLIQDETSKRLSRLAMRMEKPIRDQSNKVKVESKKEKNKKIDAMDVLLGLANYN